MRCMLLAQYVQYKDVQMVAFLSTLPVGSGLCNPSISTVFKRIMEIDIIYMWQSGQNLRR